MTKQQTTKKRECCCTRCGCELTLREFTTSAKMLCFACERNQQDKVRQKLQVVFAACGSLYGSVGL